MKIFKNAKKTNNKKNIDKFNKYYTNVVDIWFQVLKYQMFLKLTIKTMRSHLAFILGNNKYSNTCDDVRYWLQCICALYISYPNFPKNSNFYCSLSVFCSVLNGYSPVWTWARTCGGLVMWLVRRTWSQVRMSITSPPHCHPAISLYYRPIIPYNAFRDGKSVNNSTDTIFELEKLAQKMVQKYA